MTVPSPSTLMPPSKIKQTPAAWLKKNLFSTWYNSLITIILLGCLAGGIRGFIIWSITQAQWQVLQANLPLFFVGRYARDQYWRIWTIVGILCGFSGLSWGMVARNIPQLFNRTFLISLGLLCGTFVIIPIPTPFKLLSMAMAALVVATGWIGQKIGQKIPPLTQWLSLGWSLAFVMILWFIGGGGGLKVVSTNDWGGLLLTLLTALISILLSFPIGVLFALGRQSTLPVVRGFSVMYIELFRGLPLIAILFMGQIMIPLFLPEGVRPDRVFRAIIGLTLFSSAYLAENVRSGLQAVPRGQTEAAKALGFSTPFVIGLIVLPQALKIAIPAIVGQFISLFQDTTLLAIVGLVELLGISRSILAQPQFLGRYSEVYLFDAVLFWVICYSLSLGSRQLEKKFNTAHR